MARPMTGSSATKSMFEHPVDATPLSPEERRGLRLPITLRSQLNAAERNNVIAGRAWALRSRKAWWTDDFLCELHSRMFGDVWTWAGAYRTTEKNIGNVSAHMVAVEVRQTLDNAYYWLEHSTYEAHELAIRLHHQLVWLHPFVNGNGRCTRLLADTVVHRLKASRFTWARGELVETGPAREAYIKALRAADDHDIGPLLAFAKL